MALESFGSAAYIYLVKEQDKAAPAQLEVSSAWHFLAFFVSAGLFSGLVSHVVATKFMYPRMVARFSAPSVPMKADTWASAVASSSASAASAAKTAVFKPILPSLGASGAIYASVTLTALAFPDSQVSLIIPPSYPIDIQTGVGALVLLDMIGAARGWRFFDHWAHLGGAAFGAAYYYYGPELWNGSANRNIINKPSKLTTWRQATAYKEIPVPPPPGVRDGQSWCLILGTRLTTAADEFLTIDLSNENVGQDVFPVISMPIHFGPRAAKKGPKQEKIERIYRLQPKDGEDTGITLKLTEQTSFDLDKKVWDSGIGLSSWLVGLEQSTHAEGLVLKLKDVIFSPQPRNILELGKAFSLILCFAATQYDRLGTGIGVVGLSLAALRSTRSPPSEGTQDRIIATDLETAIPLIEHNVAVNAAHLQNTRFQAAVLDWDDDTLPDFVQEFPEGFDAIIMADVTYNTASFPSLVHTLSKLVKLGKEPPLVLLGYKERDSAERSLWDLVCDFGLSLKKVGTSPGAGGAPVEIWVGEINPNK
ncbi:hypothetical protein C0992_011913 [Termitomyces sp. T32_za158]|nr:hypothetical protein C0992_011913 [Termitomyces sp. T32_za158]